MDASRFPHGPFRTPRAPRSAVSEPQAPLPAPSLCGAHRGQQQQFPVPEGHSGRPGGKGGWGGESKGATGGQGCASRPGPPPPRRWKTAVENSGSPGINNNKGNDNDKGDNAFPSVKTSEINVLPQPPPPASLGPGLAEFPARRGPGSVRERFLSEKSKSRR